jgi:hypothetical protein
MIDLYSWPAPNGHKVQILGLTLEEGLRLENALWNTNLSLPDTLNGPRAFMEKRKFVPTQEV